MDPTKPRARITRAAATRHACATDPHRWWRTKTADSFSQADIATLDRAVADGPAFLHPDWPAARRGEAAAAIGVAMHAVKTAVSRHATDVVMTAVLRIAVRGDRPSRIVMCHVLRRLAARHAAYGAVETSWIHRELADASAS